MEVFVFILYMSMIFINGLIDCCREQQRFVREALCESAARGVWHTDEAHIHWSQRGETGYHGN